MSKNHSNLQSDGACRHVRKDPITGEVNYFFPLEITAENEEMMKLLAQERGLEICRTVLGCRYIQAVMIPCKNVATIHGLEVFVDTPTEIQRDRYHELMKDELAAQDAAKQDGRCWIPDGRGGTKRCPMRVPNPNYSPDGDTRKTLPVSCEGCRYEQYRQAHTVIPFCCLDPDDEDSEWFEPPAEGDVFSGDRFLKRRVEFVEYVREREPKFAPLANLLSLGFNNSEAARLLGLAPSTVKGWHDKLGPMLTEFLETT